MGRLAGFRYRDIATRFRRHGFEPHRNAKSSHEVWLNSANGRRTVLVNHSGTMPEGTLRNALKLAGISPEDFLAD